MSATQPTATTCAVISETLEADHEPARTATTLPEATTDLALTQEPVIVALQQVGLHVPHTIQKHANQNQNTGSTEKLSSINVHAHG